MNKIGLMLIISLLLTTGCVNVKYSERTQYVLDVSTPRKIKTTASNKILEIDNTSIAPQFSSINFTYRISSTNYLTDYYNTFLNPPSQQIDSLITNYLNHTGLFRYVTNDDDYDHANYTLHAKILELYADYRYREKPTGVIAIEFTLFKQAGLETNVIMNKIFKERIPLAAKDSQSLINAWNQGLEKTLQSLTNKLSDTVESDSILNRDHTKQNS